MPEGSEVPVRSRSAATTAPEMRSKTGTITRRTRPTQTQRRWLKRGIDQPGGKLPLFDNAGQLVNPQTIRSCITQGWAEPWFFNPRKPDWLVCKLTDAGRALFDEK
jgi:hypothetical protein